ncbi:MAG: hypothetical protein OEY20_08670 [Gemmatimonadota bacterium]|nr:hypothetical protein [Gemmatimonadota bacterium]MDH5197311.1 hypothetical protein [Gemmatimonadota bacterium]
MPVSQPSVAPSAHKIDTRRRARPATAAARSRRETAAGLGWLVAWLGIAGTLLYYGHAYYLTPLQERAYSDLRGQFSPSGTVGLGYGFIGTAMMIVGVAGYSSRRRIRILHRLGKLKSWLSVHIFLCTMGPFLIVLHSSFKVGGIISIAFWSMMAVVASGVFGRYVYVRIPKTLNGQFLTLKGVEEQRDALLQVIAERSGLSTGDVAAILAAAKRPSPRGFMAALYQSIWYDLTESRHGRRIQGMLAAKGVPPKARATAARLFLEEVALEHQTALLAPFQQMFKYWHLFHMPLAIVMLVVVLLHVTIAVLLGYTWIF